MARTSPTQLVRVTEVADLTALGDLALQKLTFHGVKIVPYWDGSAAVSFDDARGFCEIVMAERAEHERRTREQAEAEAEKQQREFEKAREKAQKEADERRRRGGVLAGGRALHVPGDGDEPAWLQ